MMRILFALTVVVMLAGLSSGCYNKPAEEKPAQEAAPAPAAP